MGKVYEALLRAETDDVSRRTAPADIEALEVEEAEVEDEPGIHGSRGYDRHVEADDVAVFHTIRGDGPGGGSDNSRFSFLRYSLGTGSIFDGGGRPGPAAALARRAPAQPSRDATIDLNRVDPHLSVLLGNDRRVNEQFNKLALTLISRSAERGFKRVLVASANHGEGRTSVALNLAGALARARQRVLVVDCDLLRPGLLERLGLTCDIGIAEAFACNLPPGSAAIRIQPFGFEVLPCRKRLENPVELLAAPGFWKMLQQFDANHDFILFDSSPLLEMGDASLLAKFTDTTLMVVESGANTTADMARAISPFTPEDLLGVVLNRTRP